MTKFTLEFTLDNAEAQAIGPRRAAAEYLREAAGKVHYYSDTDKAIFDGNGARIGQWEFTDISLEKRYRLIVFLDHEETTDDEGNLITDQALRLLHHKTDNSVLWECPTQESTNEAVGYMLAWDYGDGEITDEPGHGSNDHTETVTYGGSTYFLTYNVGLSYISLQEVTEVSTL